MPIELPDTAEQLRLVVRDFAEAEIAPHAEEWDRTETFPVEVVRQMGELGLFGIPFPEEYGGGGADLTTLCVAIEELARVDQSVAITLEAGVGLGANPIHRFGPGSGSPSPTRAATPAAPARGPCSTRPRGSG
jgi:butyryl-CoA dehydrogenase